MCTRHLCPTLLASPFDSGAGIFGGIRGLAGGDWFHVNQGFGCPALRILGQYSSQIPGSSGLSKVRMRRLFQCTKKIGTRVSVLGFRLVARVA